MTIEAIGFTTRPRFYWQWGKLAGLLALALLLLLGPRAPRLVVALCLHLVLDFTLQSTQVALSKSRSKRALVCHALIAGTLPLLVANFADPATALASGLFGFLTHLLVDAANKFGLPEHAGAFVDQALHVASLVVGVVA